MKIEIKVVVDGTTRLTQPVSREALDEQIWPVLEAEANRQIEEHQR